MLRQSVSRIVLAYLVLFVAVSSSAADNVLQAIPDSALAVGYVKELQHTNEQVSKVAGLVSSGVPNLLEAAMAASGVREGVDKTGMMAVALLPRPEAAPGAVVLLPTTDYAAFIRQLNPDEPTARIVEAMISEKRVVIGRKGSFAVVARPDDRSLVEAVLDSKQSIQARVAPLQAFLDESDASLVFTERGIKTGITQALKALRSVKSEIVAQASDQAETIAAALGVYESIFEAIQDNVIQAAVVARVEDDGTVRIASRTMLRTESKLAALTKPDDAPRSNPLRGLPPGPFVFAFAGETPQGWADGMMKWSFQMWQNMGIAKNVPQEKMDKLVEAGVQSMKGVRGMGMSMSVGQQDEPLYGRMYLTIHVDDAEAYLDRYAKMVKAMSELAADDSLPFYNDMQVKKIRVGESSGLNVSMGLGSVPGTEDADLEALFRKMFGGDKLQVFLAAADERTVVGAYTSKKQLLRALRAARSEDGGLAGNRQLRTTADLLPEDAQWVAYFSPQGGVEFAKIAMALFAPEGPRPELPEFPQSPPIGFAVKLSGQAIQTELVVPAATLQAIGQFVGDVRNQFNRQKLQPPRASEND